MRIYSLVAVPLLALTLVGCSSGATGDGRDCIDVPAEAMERIADGANAAPIEPTVAGSVRSESFEDAYIVAMTFTAEDGTEDEGAWALAGSLEQPSAILSLGAVSALYTDWPREVNGEELDVTEDGVTEAKACLAALGD